MKKMYKSLLLGVILGILSIHPSSAMMVACTQEAKLCPDGKTYVSRTGSNCEFSVCPSTQIACTKEYAPVCAQPPMQDCPEGMGCPAVMPQPKTYSNSCMAKSAGADILYEGECGSQSVVCTQEAKLCPDGKTYVSRTGPNCEFSACPSTGVVCTEEYAPVCGTPGCKGTACNYAGISAPKTYSNMCFLKADGASFLYKGECGNTEESGVDVSGEGEEGGGYGEDNPGYACTMEAKLCSDGVTYVGREGPNCEFQACPSVQKSCPVFKLKAPNEGCYYAYSANENGCMVPKQLCDGISFKTREKLDGAIESLLAKVEKRYAGNETQISSFLKSFNRSLEKAGKSKPKLVPAIDYITQRLEEHIEEYNN